MPFFSAASRRCSSAVLTCGASWTRCTPPAVSAITMRRSGSACGVAYMPFTAAVLIASGTASQLVARIGPIPLLLAGSVASTGGLYWLSRISVDSTYTGGLVGPTMVTGVGIGLVFVPASLVALSRVDQADSGVGLESAEHSSAGRRRDGHCGARHRRVGP